MAPEKIKALELIEKFQNTKGQGHTLGLKAAKRYATICVDEIQKAGQQEIVIQCLKKKYTIVEIPSRENARAWGNSKLNTITGLKLLFLMIKQLYW